MAYRNLQEREDYGEMDQRLAYEEESGGRAHQRGDLVGADCHEGSHRRLGALPDEPARRRHSPAPLRTAWVDSTLPHPQSYDSSASAGYVIGSLEEPLFMPKLTKIQSLIQVQVHDRDIILGAILSLIEATTERNESSFCCF
jgi:hypothetical protein